MDTLQALFLLGRPFGPLYGLAMRLRARLYAGDHLTRHHLPVPVVSVGNLVLGGSGKTPMVRYLAEMLQRLGYRPAVISRGYGGTAKLPANIVSDGRQVLLSPEQGGDEPCMLAQALPGVPVLVGRRRIDPCRLAITEFQCDILILDDGFQHLSVRRDLDLVLFDATIQTGGGRIFPAGILREPMSALKRADAIVLTGISGDNGDKAGVFAQSLQSVIGDTPVFTVSLADPELHWLSGEPTTSPVFFAFSGIANPERFEKTVAALGLKSKGFLALPDHVRYDQRLVADLQQRAIAAGAGHLLTTAKDYIKLRELHLALPLAVIDVRLQPQPRLENFLSRRLEYHQPAGDKP